MDTDTVDTVISPDTAPSRLGETLRNIGLTSWALLGILLLTAAILWILGRFQILLAPLVLAWVIVHLLDPLVDRLHARQVPRLLGALLTYVVAGGLIVLLGALVIPSITSQVSQLGSEGPAIYEDLSETSENLLHDFGFTEVMLPTYDEVVDFVTDPTVQEDIVARALVQLGNVTLTLLEALLVFFLAPVIAFYVLLDLPQLRETSKSLIPTPYRDEVVHVGTKLNVAVGGFLRGQLFVALIVGVLSSIGFWAIGLPFWLLIGMIAGALNIIPFVGPWVGGGLGVLVALVVTRDPATALWAAGVALGVQQIDNNFISPTVLRATVRLHPAVIILSLLAGGATGGLWGVLLAVPLVAAIKIVIGHVWRTRVLDQSWEEVHEAVIVRIPDEDRPMQKRRKVEQPVDDLSVSVEETRSEVVDADPSDGSPVG